MPNIILKTLNLKFNDKVEIREENEQIIISKVKNQSLTLKSLCLTLYML
ncbi:MAG: AbrB/MazE/SpoVT family DNA-binding domain-containing protein [Bacilli bacterium]|nr:AbrB/MazE/SpoVT family DNA-binding domain-containing protein [Bacilli bacterium]